MLNLKPDELLTTTRAVRKRLDFERPVEPGLIQECLGVATQGPTGGNTQGWHFVVVYDAKKRAALADIYREAWKLYKQAPGSVFELFEQAPPSARKDQLSRVAESADYLADNLHRAPVHVIPCIGGRVDRVSGAAASAILASMYGSILPATWNFMLAARARGLGTVWTTCHLIQERAAAGVLGIPYETFSQCALIPTAYSLGTDFRPALRNPLDEIVHVDQW